MTLDTAPLSSTAAPLQRSRGALSVAWAAGSKLQRLSQAGSARAIALPGPELVVLNTSGGLTGGDRQHIQLSTGPGNYITATTQTAERVYKTSGGEADISLDLRIEAGARLDWLPQETILFNRSAACRRTFTTLAADATSLSCETVILGRTAMKEVIDHLHFRDERRFIRAGHLVHLEPLRLSPETLHRTEAGLANARAISGIVFLTQGAEDALGPVRDALTEPGVIAAASAFDGRLVVRLMAADNWPLRRQLIRLLTVLRPSPLPRVWHS